MLKEIKLKILNKLLRHLFNAVTEEDVLVVVGKNVIIGGATVSESTRQEIISGAKAFTQFPFWKLLKQEMQMAANRKLYNEATSKDDLIFPKAVLWTLDVMEKKAQNLSRL